MSFLLSVCLALFTVLAPASPVAADTGNSLFQLSTLPALMAGVYDGAMTIEELSKHGDFGLGTFDALDGEMIVFNGRFYQAKDGGSVETVMSEQTSPFAQLTLFDPEMSLTVEGVTDINTLVAAIQAGLSSVNYPYAIKITGEFESVLCRSVPAQKRPYPPLGDVVAHQKTFSFENQAGVMVGFFGPSYTSNFGVPGFHFHYLTADREGGGHVLNVKAKTLLIEIDALDSIMTILPKNEAFAQLPAAETTAHATDK
ncbi:acetolactate decarboxylase [Desulfovibrio inopinatus]|uniref:acetolactate decarboxylase n=1 Tax=Desulfovibrio inopinatus TaxID=102109 RepID=UPI00146FB681|nr:acetolactate decarboxylase [Desulfovibrio inopinatus]